MVVGRHRCCAAGRGAPERVDAVAVQSFRSRLAFLPGTRLDPELMRLDAPDAIGREVAEQRAAEPQNGPHRLAVADVVAPVRTSGPHCRTGGVLLA